MNKNIQGFLITLDMPSQYILLLLSFSLAIKIPSYYPSVFHNAIHNYMNNNGLTTSFVSNLYKRQILLMNSLYVFLFPGYIQGAKIAFPSEDLIDVISQSIANIAIILIELNRRGYSKSIDSMF